MIRRLIRKFMLICTISVFAVVTVIFLIIAGLNIASMNRNIDMLTDSLSEGGGMFPDSFDDRLTVPPSAPAQKSNNGFITPETRYATRHFTVWLDSEGKTISSNTDFIYSITDKVAEEYAGQAVQKGHERGWISHYRYKVYRIKEGVGVVFVDGAMTRSSVTQFLLILGAVLILSAVFILLLILLLSKRMIQPIAESYEKQKQFVTDANHELKTPLTLILANLDIAEAELGKNEWLDDIRSEGHRMSELVNQLVALSRMDEEASPLSVSEIPFGKIVSDTVAEFEALAYSRGKPLSSDIDAQIVCMGDEILLRRLIGILMDNALQYCDSDGEIRVTLQKRRQIVLTVENTYRDVDSLEFNRLFDRFYRADKARTFSGGYGVGLSMAKSIAERHKGEITAFKKDATHICFKVVFKH